MKIKFYKYQGTGNDFVMIDNRDLHFPKEDVSFINQLCDRKFGIGADGLILLENDENADFRMVYYNADGNQSTMCGNGGRCIVKFAYDLGIIEQKTTFYAIDGKHYAEIIDDKISLQMIDVVDIKVIDNESIFLNTGSPHHIQLVQDIDTMDVYTLGKKIRYSSLYQPNGTNVNFVRKIGNNNFKIRTYERGVEEETLSCGTGATAVAIGMHYLGMADDECVNIGVQGGELTVRFNKINDSYLEVFLQGPATFVFKGIWG